jgi:hypothetical protein
MIEALSLLRYREIRVYWLKFWAMMLPVITLGAVSAATFFGMAVDWGPWGGPWADWRQLTWTVLGISGVLIVVSVVLFNRVIAWTGNYFQSVKEE